MEQILDTPINTSRNLRYAGFWIRVAAYLIDGLLLGVLNAIVQLLVLGDIAAFSRNASPNFTAFGFYFLAMFTLYTLYFCGMESSVRQATLGKMAVGIKVGDSNGERISFANALGRFFAKIISALILYIGFMMAGWDSKKQALHDKLADTYVFYSSR